ncbi:response regulator transcription factor [Thermomonas sp. HDW16]|uniref:response regulator transcription factor n=1 Tax=Thermomonas sp. HDW16 TaxID=2714945 RepID=UPI00140C7516|nr:response regulator transcription factor [Thermomonas sp. HDW16]QIL19576.1 response regulator transcription factor [Thermomonas sp. HDW16]
MPAHAIDATAGLRVLVIEDQHDIAANIWDFLERRGYQVDHCADGASGLTRALRDPFDAIVLDLGLPRLDGLDLCRQLRVAGHGVPVLMLTARDTLDDKLRGYAEGADDYMVKPFAMRELDARLRALTRHADHAAQPPDVGGLRYEPRAMLAIREGQRIPLTRLQGALLASLLRNHPNVSTHQALLRAGWGEDGGDVAALQTQIYELRTLVDRPFAQPLIQSVRGVGYRLRVSA